MLQQTSIKVIGRAAAILRACSQQPAGRSLGDLAADVGVPRSSVQRIVAALAAEGLLFADGTRSGIRLGSGLYALADAARIDVVEFAHPFLKSLALAVGETVDLAVLRGDHLVFVDQIAGEQRLRAVSAVGERFPLHCTANGKAVLALLPGHLVRQHLGGCLKRFTPKTIVSTPRLLKEIDRIRNVGVAFDREEHSLGISAIGAAFADRTGAIYAVSIPMPSIRFAVNSQGFKQKLLTTIADIEAGLATPSRRRVLAMQTA